MSRFTRTIPTGSSFQRSQSDQEIRFSAKGVDYVRVKMKPGLSVDQASLPDDAQIPASSAGFRVGRLILNLKATLPSGQTLELYIRYSQEDVSFAGNTRQNLKLAYLLNDQWNVINGVNWDDPNFAYVALTDWPDDPPMSVGR